MNFQIQNSFHHSNSNFSDGGQLVWCYCTDKTPRNSGELYIYILVCIEKVIGLYIMERTLLVIRVFSSLIKVEHHRSFLEFCRYNNTIPVGLRLKKSSSCYGERNFEFEDSWNNVLQATEKQLLLTPGGGHRSPIDWIELRKVL